MDEHRKQFSVSGTKAGAPQDMRETHFGRNRVFCSDPPE